MTDTASPNAAAKFSGAPGGPFELVLMRPQPANSQIGRGQFATIDANGYATLNGGAYVLPAGLGFPSIVSDTDPTAGRSRVVLWQGTETGLTQSTVNQDGFTDADMCVPFWIADAQTPGKLPVVSGVDRAIGGLVFGMEPGSTTNPRLVTGSLAGLLGLLAHALANELGGGIAYAVDASASTDLGTAANPIILPRAKRRGKFTGFRIVPSASLSATSGNDATITFVKVDTTGAVALASSPVVATFTTTTALVAGVAAAFTLGAASALKFRTTDVLGYYRTHAGTGAVIPQSAITPDFQVI